MTGFVCEVDGQYRSACEALDFYAEHKGKQYCVLHFPSEDKKDEFETVVESKLARKDYDFSCTVFPIGASKFFEKLQFDEDVRFTWATFHGKAAFSEATFRREAEFTHARFNSEADFSKATFRREADFFEGRFKRAAFQDATFLRSAKFVRATFSDTSDRSADFHRATFTGELYFRETMFCGYTDFHRASFLDTVKFIEYEVTADEEPSREFCLSNGVSFARARIEKPELFSFDTVQLRPSWFINIDARNFDLTDVKWYGMPGGPEGTLDKEIGALKDRGVVSPYTLLAQACRRLSANAEENREYSLANEFHYWSMNALRKAGWNRLGLVGTLYWALSGYGVRAARAFLVLVAIWAAFTVRYVLVSPSEFNDFGQGIGYLWQAAVYSLLSLARLNPEPRPEEPGVFQFLVGLEGILGPLQIALLALAIRRKVMR